jgi:hypothetical protein
VKNENRQGIEAVSVPNATQVHLNGASAFKRRGIMAQTMRHKGSQKASNAGIARLKAD